MSDAAQSRTPARSEPAPGSDWEWLRPDGLLWVGIEARAVDRLRREAIRGLKAIPKRGLEVGGLLLGWVEPSDAGSRVLIRGLEPVPCEYRFGPGYLLSNLDLQAFKTALESLRSIANPQFGAVGYYRTETRGDGQLRPEELVWLERFFPEPNAIFLLITPSVFGESTARVFYREGSRIAASPEREAFGSATAVVAQPAKAPERISQEQPSPASQRRSAPPTSVRLTTLWDCLGALALLIGIGVAAAIMVTRYPNGPRQVERLPAAPATQSSDLGLEVLQRSGHLLLTWNRSAPEIIRARRATLWIRDSAAERRLEIDPVQLRATSLFYMPAGQDIQFRLELLLDRDRRVAESIRVLGPKPTGDQVAAGQAGRSILVAESDARLLTHRLGPVHTAIELDRSDTSTEPISHAAFRKGVADAASTADSGFQPLRPPVLDAAAGREPLLKIAGLGLEPRLLPAPEPLASTPEKSVSAPLPEPVDYFAPRVMARAYPHVPAGVRSMLSGEAIVHVSVAIDPDGQVTSAKAEANARRLQAYLIDSAVEAARRFRFQPAHQNGQPVPGELVLTFRFVR